MSRLHKLKERLVELGVSPKRSLGQNFLISDHVISKILGCVDEYTPQAVIEIGPGLGALTEDLYKTYGDQFTVFELDRAFSQYWRDQGLKVEEGDALKFDWHSAEYPERTLLVSNLPYQIAASLVIELSVGPKAIFAMILMFQKEVAQRMVAKPSTGNYGLLSVIAQVAWDVRLLLEAGSRDFYPAPNVASRVLKFSRKVSGKDGADIEMKPFIGFVKAAFQQRRKKLVKNLEPWVLGDRQSVIAALQGISVDEGVRAEELSPQQFVDLYKALKE